MSTAKQIRRLVKQLKDLEKMDIKTAVVLTLRLGSYGVAFVRERNGEPETLIEFDLLKLAEELEGDK